MPCTAFTPSLLWKVTLLWMATVAFVSSPVFGFSLIFGGQIDVPVPHGQFDVFAVGNAWYNWNPVSATQEIGKNATITFTGRTLIISCIDGKQDRNATLIATYEQCWYAVSYAWNLAPQVKGFFQGNVWHDHGTAYIEWRLR
ncbi:hypothetical protein B0O80DRAFT_448604 [Mortierella sp. GBAus27b]|nr:hypothetical protein B0O80DRAFT_448604 [Mortierella sp. GBAus27b]